MTEGKQVERGQPTTEEILVTVGTYIGLAPHQIENLRGCIRVMGLRLCAASTPEAAGVCEERWLRAIELLKTAPSCSEAVWRRHAWRTKRDDFLSAPPSGEQGHPNAVNEDQPQASSEETNAFLDAALGPQEPREEECIYCDHVHKDPTVKCSECGCAYYKRRPTAPTDKEEK